MTNFCGGHDARAETYFCGDLTQIKDYLVEVHVRRSSWRFLACLGEVRSGASGEVGRGYRHQGQAGKLGAKDGARGIQAGKRDRSARSRACHATLANKLVISKIKDALGLDRAAGRGQRRSADLGLDAGVLRLDRPADFTKGYGMTETTAIASVQPYGKLKFGTIGKPLPGVEAMIADDGEIMLKGLNMVKGYLRLPDRTAELYQDHDDWMHTGDLGAIDEDGYISITGRKKDLIITAGGKNVAPAEMEGLPAIDCWGRTSRGGR